MPSGELVLVTGASGYIAIHVVKILLENGYRVRGTVRALKDDVKLKPLHVLQNSNPKYELDIIEADLNDAKCWPAIIKDCVYVHHIASPFVIENPKKEGDLIRPAVNGTLAILKACGDSVKRVVLTSSACAVNNGFGVREDKPWTEEDWTDPDSVTNTFVKSKTLAEKVAWNYMKTKSVETFDLAVINPSFVMGPALCGIPGASMKIMQSMMQNDSLALANFGHGFCDIRDVAQAHLNAMTIPEASDKRHIIAPSLKFFKDIALILKEEFGPQGYSITTRVMPDFMAKMISPFNSTIRALKDGLSKDIVYDCTRMKDVLGIEPREFENTIRDMAYSMIELGHIHKSKQYTGPKYSEKFP